MAGVSLYAIETEAVEQPASRFSHADQVTTVIEAARSGDREAQGQLYKLYGPMVHGILLARVPYDQVDDLMQDVFLQAFNKLPSLRAAGAFGGWLAMIARNRATDFHRRKRETEEVPETIAQPESMNAEAAEAFYAINSLPESYRETLILRLVEGLNGPEIAERTGLTPASVRVNLHRGMKMLREKLGLHKQL
jgi:RNA polymerase sigma-70 factor (ECF subfamily)